MRGEGDAFVVEMPVLKHHQARSGFEAGTHPPLIDVIAEVFLSGLLASCWHEG